MQGLEHIIRRAQEALDALDAPPGLIDAELAAEREARATRARLREIREAVVEHIPIPVEDARAIVDGKLNETRAVRVARKWLDTRPTPWLVLSGGVGCGKTLAAVYAAAELGGMYITAPELVECFARAAREKTEAAILRTPMLIVDDLGTEDDKPATFASALFRLMSHRNRRRTVFTTNLTRERLLDPERYTLRFAERLEHMTTTADGRSLIVELGGKSLRRKAVAP